MIVTECEKRPQREHGKAILVGVQQPVTKHGCILSCQHEHALFQRQTIHVEYPTREGVKTELLNEVVPLWADRLWKLICREFKPLIPDQEGLLEFGKQDKTIHWRAQRHDQQAMVASCVRATDRARSKTAEAVRFEPLQSAGLGIVSACH